MEVAHQARHLGRHRNNLAVGLELLENFAEGRLQRRAHAALNVDVDAIEAVLGLVLLIGLDEAECKVVLILLVIRTVHVRPGPGRAAEREDVPPGVGAHARLLAHIVLGGHARVRLVA